MQQWSRVCSPSLANSHKIRSRWVSNDTYLRVISYSYTFAVHFHNLTTGHRSALHSSLATPGISLQTLKYPPKRGLEPFQTLSAYGIAIAGRPVLKIKK